MRLIISNAKEELSPGTFYLLKRAKLATQDNYDSECAINLPIGAYPHQFSIEDHTLYYGLQWIGTVSKSSDTSKEMRVHINYTIADQVLCKYARQLIIQEKKRKSISLGSLYNTPSEISPFLPLKKQNQEGKLEASSDREQDSDLQNRACSLIK